MILGLVGIIIAVIAFMRAERLEKEIRALKRLVEILERRAPAHAPPLEPPTVAPPNAIVPSASPPAVPDSPTAPHEPSPPASRAPADVAPAAAVKSETGPALPRRSAASREAAPTVSRNAEVIEVAETLERRIGERLFLYLGMIVVVLGVAFFLRYAFEHDWISPAIRVALGIAAGVAFIAAGRALTARDYRQYGLFVTGGGLAILFLSFYAAYAFYELIGQTPAFALLVATAAWAAQLADRNASLPLALMAVCGGFATPFLVGGRGDAHLVLFSYDAVLVAATLVLARRQQWPWLNLVSLAFVVATLAAWGDVHYNPSLYLRVELFLTIFCVLFSFAIRDARASTHHDSHIVGHFLLIAPLLYHAASVGVLGTSETALLIYLVLASAAVVAISHLPAETPLLRLAGWLLVIVPFVFVAFASAGFTRSEMFVSLIIWLLFVFPAIRLVGGRGALGWADIALVHAGGVGAFVGFFAARHHLSTSSALASMAASLAGANLAIWWPRRAARQALHWVGVAATLTAIAIAIGFQGWWGVVAWGVEAATLIWLGSRERELGMRLAGLVLFVLAAVMWLFDHEMHRIVSGMPLFNARTLTAGALIAAMYLAAWVMAPADHAVQRRELALLIVGASLMTVLALTFEIRAYWAGQLATGSDAFLSRELMLSAAWSAYGGLLVSIGMRYRYPPVRYFAIALFGVTIVKVFAVDVQQLDGIYRVLAFLAVGGILLLASFLYQRSRRRGDDVREASE